MQIDCHVWTNQFRIFVLELSSRLPQANPTLQLRLTHKIGRNTLSYIDNLHTEVIQAFNWEADNSGPNSHELRILLQSGEWVQGGLNNHNDATFTIQISSGSDGEYTRLEIPYHSVAALERRSVR